MKFLYSNNDELFLILSQILNNKFDLAKMGLKAKENIENYYTFTGNKKKYIQFLSYGDI